MLSFVYDGFFCWRVWSVRTYNALRRSNIHVTCAEDAVQVGNLAIRGRIRNAGIMTAIELYRAGGLGVYEILNRVNYELIVNRGRDAWSIETIRALCEDFDRLFHSVF